MLFIYVLFLIAWLVLSIYHFVFLLKYFQLEEYNNLRFIKLILNLRHLSFRYPEGLALITALLAYISRNSAMHIATLLISFISMGLSFLVIRRSKKDEIKKLVLTARAKRLIFVGFLMYILVAYIVIQFIFLSDDSSAKWVITNSSFMTGLIFLILFGQFTSIHIVITNLLTCRLKSNIYEFIY